MSIHTCEQHVELFQHQGFIFVCVLPVTEMTDFLSNVASSESISIKFSLIAPSFLVVFQFQLLTSWGDPYYIGLTGLELFDEHGDQILLTENSIL